MFRDISMFPDTEKHVMQSMKGISTSGTVRMRKKDGLKTKRSKSFFGSSDLRSRSAKGKEPMWMKRQSACDINMHDIEAGIEIRPVHQRFNTESLWAMPRGSEIQRDSGSISSSSVCSSSNASSKEVWCFSDGVSVGETTDSDCSSLQSVTSICRHEDRIDSASQPQYYDLSSDDAGPAVPHRAEANSAASENVATVVPATHQANGIARASVPVPSSDKTLGYHSRNSSIAEILADDIITPQPDRQHHVPKSLPPPPPYEANHRIVHLGGSSTRRKRVQPKPSTATTVLCSSSGKHSVGCGGLTRSSSMTARSVTRTNRRNGRLSLRAGSMGTLRTHEGSTMHQTSEHTAAPTTTLSHGERRARRRLIGRWSHDSVLVEALRVLDGASGLAQELHTTDLDDEDAASSDSGSQGHTDNFVAGVYEDAASGTELDDVDDDSDFDLGPPASTPPPPPTCGYEHISLARTVPGSGIAPTARSACTDECRTNETMGRHERVPLRTEETAYEGVSATNLANLRLIHVERQLLLREQAKLQAAFNRAPSVSSGCSAPPKQGPAQLPPYDFAPPPNRDNGAASDMDFDDCDDTQSVCSLPKMYYPPPSAMCSTEELSAGLDSNSDAAVPANAGRIATPSRLLEIAAEAERLQREHDAHIRRQRAETWDADQRAADDMAALLNRLT
eukprot:m.1212996 g.1212996  ORF g.1212996 m.1212996 type:complete len:677 (+) comp24601_c0_seq8:631-2661(+)